MRSRWIEILHPTLTIETSTQEFARFKWGKNMRITVPISLMDVND